ncbi:hypothetical protein E2C01_050741 [Portunus trituberculatus]|uniref:Uncharacterized protein n=1 Tax=Portunus trituberculatus TaxID=210409 RepID=A0A5B7GH61_PORTR|nr:hypothetical protein [Portunus trituberculatus]
MTHYPAVNTPWTPASPRQQPPPHEPRKLFVRHFRGNKPKKEREVDTQRKSIIAFTSTIEGSSTQALWCYLSIGLSITGSLATMGSGRGGNQRVRGGGRGGPLLSCYLGRISGNGMSASNIPRGGEGGDDGEGEFLPFLIRRSLERPSTAAFHYRWLIRREIQSH